MITKSQRAQVNARLLSPTMYIASEGANCCYKLMRKERAGVVSNPNLCHFA